MPLTNARLHIYIPATTQKRKPLLVRQASIPGCWRRHGQRWQRTQRRPSLQPLALPLYLQPVPAQKSGWPIEPIDGQHSASEAPVPNESNSEILALFACTQQFTAPAVPTGTASGPNCGSRRHWHWWQSGQLAPLRHPPLRRTYLQAWPQLCGCPWVPTEKSAATAVSDFSGRSRCQWHRWHSRQLAPFRQPPFLRAYLHGGPQLCGCPTEPTEVTIGASSVLRCRLGGGGTSVVPSWHPWVSPASGVARLRPGGGRKSGVGTAVQAGPLWRLSGRWPATGPRVCCHDCQGQEAVMGSACAASRCSTAAGPPAAPRGCTFCAPCSDCNLMRNSCAISVARPPSLQAVWQTAGGVMAPFVKTS
mmetsp:Transcript_14198/g.43867  ORF Transcript_14198/g.43867 Transcript_14198/m.43867 type:complete len:362 (+) Transcript_14198:20-1105(+)